MKTQRAVGAVCRCSRRLPERVHRCGDTTRNIEVMCQTGPDGISVDENVDLLKAKEITDRT